MEQPGRILAGPSRSSQVRRLVAIVSLAVTIRCSSRSSDLGRGGVGEPVLDASTVADTEVPPDNDVPPDANDDCAGGSFGEASDGERTPLASMATVEFLLGDANELVELEATLVVPGLPAPAGTFFVWPGLQPLPIDVQRHREIGNGVLQAVLTWGPTCAPQAPAVDYVSWWISGEYVNLDSTDDTLLGCHGGPGIVVAKDDALHIVLKKSNTTWDEHIVDTTSGAVADYSVDLGAQPQKRALFAIERPKEYLSVSVAAEFTKVRVTFANPEPAACQPAARGGGDRFTRPRTSKNGRTCCIDELSLSSTFSDPR